MKKTTIILIAIIAFAAIIVTQEIITGRLITGRVPSQETGVSIYVLPSTATLSIHSPQANKTYLNDTYIMLNFTEDNADDMWYNLNNGSNISITSVPPTYFSVSADGIYTLYLFAENEYGETEEEVSFTVNTTQLTILYDEFSDNTTEGESTDFIIYPFEDIQNLSNVVLEHSSYGKIRFTQNINLTADESPDDNLVDLNSHINISKNRIEVNTTALPNFQKAAQLQLYGLTFSNPQVLKDGVVCTSCTEDSYSGGVLTFSVTSFSVYSSRETPASTGGTGGVSRGGTPWISTAAEDDGETTEFAPALIKKALSYFAEASPEKRVKIVASTVLMSVVVFLVALMINLSGISLSKRKPR